MRPSCPPPMHATRVIGRRTRTPSRRRIGQVEHGLRLRRAVGGQALADAAVGARENGRGEQRGIDRARPPDRERPHRDAGRHLHDREQRVDPLERLRLDRDAEHGQRGLRRSHPGQMRGASRPRDDHLQPSLLGRACVLEEEVGRSVRGHDPLLVVDPERSERLRGMAHRLPVGAWSP